MAKQARALLYCDLLGTKGVFNSGGLTAVQGRYRRFAQLIGQSLAEAETTYSTKTRSAELTSDSAILRFDSPSDAVLVGCTLWTRVFREDDPDGSDAGLSLRGVLIPMDTSKALRRNLRVPQYPEVVHWEQSPTLLRAILYEQSGAKGMRLMMPGNFISQAMHSQVVQALSEQQETLSESVLIAQQVDGLGYPDGRQDWKDVLWPILDIGRLAEFRLRAQNRSSESRSADVKEQQASTVKLIEATQQQIR